MSGRWDDSYEGPDRGRITLNIRDLEAQMIVVNTSSKTFLITRLLPRSLLTVTPLGTIRTGRSPPSARRGHLFQLVRLLPLGLGPVSEILLVGIYMMSYNIYVNC